ncbi:MAG TPA: aminotransferase class I/II-fold pyridoxal phosphate-dependent enzyme [Gaiellaceae bacterium]|nr:aminotransferase class I/II-fold pyridoxal phosphate-dependent enzyme [Gaiellaceae bacterium]
MRQLAPEFRAYEWAPPTDEVARIAGIDPSQVLRFDQNTPPLPLPSTRPGAIAGALARVSGYPGGGYRRLRAAIAAYAGVEPENVVLGAGADDLILLCARAFAGPGDTVALPPPPTYPLFRIAAQLAGATTEPGSSRSDEPGSRVLTFACRPNNPTGALDALPDARPLVVDEAYFEYAGESAVPLIAEDDEVVVIRTFSKAFALAGARIGYALAAPETAAELNARQAPAPVSSLSAELALAALAAPPDVAPVVEERERLASALRALGLDPLPSHANFVYVPVDDGAGLGDRLLRQGMVVRASPQAIRISVLDREDDDLLVEALARVLDRPSPVAAAGGRRVRTLRATAETRIAVRLALDGASRVRVASGAGLYDHFLEQLAFHAGFDLVLEGAGDLETGEHHTAEDAALALGGALDRALGDRRGIARYGDAVVPMDDALARAAVDLGGRAQAELRLERDPGLAGHVLASLAQSARAAIHVEASGRDDHHVAEAAFKAVGRALRVAVRRESEGLPSTKGVL